MRTSSREIPTKYLDLNRIEGGDLATCTTTVDEELGEVEYQPRDVGDEEDEDDDYQDRRQVSGLPGAPRPGG